MIGHALIALLGIVLLLTGCKGYRYQQDNVAEEIGEEVLKAKTGADVDFSPSTPETGFSPKYLYPLKKEGVK